MKNYFKTSLIVLGILLLNIAFQFAPVALARIVQQEDFYQTVDLGQTGRLECLDCDLQLRFESQTGDVVYTGVLMTTVPAPTETAVPTVVATAEATETVVVPTETLVPTETPTAVNTPVATPTAVNNGYFPSDRVTKIMAFGDSITSGETQNSSYLFWLNSLLNEQGFSFDMVGPNNGVRFSGTVDQAWDMDHAAYRGQQPDSMLDLMRNGKNAIPGDWAETYNPDIVLIHLGTNGHLPNHRSDLKSADGDYLAIINEFRSVNPNVVIFVSQIAAHQSPNSEWTADFNIALQAMAGSESTESSPIIVVDNYTGFTIENHTDDSNNHLNEAGAIKMANNWFAALAPASPPGAAVPTETPTATPEPVVSVGTQAPPLIDLERCVAGGQAGNIYNIYEGDDGWWQSTYSPDFIENTSSPDLIPIVASEVTAGRDINMDHNLTWCLTPVSTGQHNIVMTVLAESNLKNDVFILVNGGIFNATIGEKQSPKTSFAFDENTSNPKKAIEFYAKQNEPMLVSFFPAETGFKLYSVRLSPIIQEPAATPSGGYPEPIDLIYPAPEV